MAKTRRKRRKRSPQGRRHGGMLMGMRTGFKGMASAVTGESTTRSSRWLGRILTILLIAAAVGLLASNL